jgi:pre-mRNA-splicing helicase BRR2
MVDQRVAEWKAKFSQLQGGKEIVSLTGEMSADLRLLEKGDVIVCTPTQVRNSYVRSFDVVLIALL